MSAKNIKPLYVVKESGNEESTAEVSKRVLEKYLAMSKKEREEFRESEEFQDAYQHLRCFNAAERRAVFGSDLLARVNEILS